MWRILQNLPRGALRNIVTRPVPKCREDEKEAAQKVQNARQFAQQQARLSHNRAILYAVSRGPSQEDGQRGCSDRNERQKEDKGDRHQKRAFTEEFWASCTNNTTEVVGLGALVLLGLQLGKLYPKHQAFRNGEKNPYCPVNWLDLASDLLKEKPSLLAARRVLSNDTSLQYDSILSQHEKRQSSSPKTPRRKRRSSSPDLRNELFNEDVSISRLDREAQALQSSNEHAQDLESVFASEDESHLEKQLKEDSSVAKKRLNVRQATREWGRLTQRFTDHVLNEAGLQQANRGNRAYAIAFWNKSESARAHFNLGICYETGDAAERNLEKACQHYEVAAAQGHVMAQFNLAVIYMEGASGVKKNPERALSLLESAAKFGLKQAQTELGVLYTEEERQDLNKAAGLFKMAADQKDKNGLFYLGICYEKGWGVVQNHCKAADMYRQAAKEGHSTAQYNLATFFERGLGGIPQDKSSAADMYEKAALLGERGAEEDAKRLRKEIQERVLEKQLRWQFDGGTKPMTSSRSSPAFDTPEHSLAQYIHLRLPEFGFADLALRIDSESGSSSCETGSRKRHASGSSTGVKFRLGAEDCEGGALHSACADTHKDSLAFGQNCGFEDTSLDSLSLQQHGSLAMMELPESGRGSRALSVL